MYKQLRDTYGLTQQEVADAIGRSANYVLKAEQLVFPAPPVALNQFYRNIDPHLTPDYLSSWYYQEQRLKRLQWVTQYVPRPFDTQHFSFRRKWISIEEELRIGLSLEEGLNPGDLVEAGLNNTGLHRQLITQRSPVEVDISRGEESIPKMLTRVNIAGPEYVDRTSPTEYRVSTGLCLPASVVYGLERNPSKRAPKSVMVALDQLLEYLTNGTAVRDLVNWIDVYSIAGRIERVIGECSK